MAREFPCGTVEVDIYEVYYDENGVPNGCTTKPVSPGSYDIKLDGVNDVRRALENMLKALDKPILWYNEGKFPQEYK